LKKILSQENYAFNNLYSILTKNGVGHDNRSVETRLVVWKARV